MTGLYIILLGVTTIAATEIGLILATCQPNRKAHPTMPTHPGQILDDIAAERTRQDQKWGEQNHPDNTGAHIVYLGFVGAMEEQARTAKERCQRNTRQQDNWQDILLEEVFEALAEDDPARLRAELIQVAADCSTPPPPRFADHPSTGPPTAPKPTTTHTATARAPSPASPSPARAATTTATPPAKPSASATPTSDNGSNAQTQACAHQQQSSGRTPSPADSTKAATTPAVAYPPTSTPSNLNALGITARAACHAREHHTLGSHHTVPAHRPAPTTWMRACGRCDLGISPQLAGRGSAPSPRHTQPP